MTSVDTAGQRDADLARYAVLDEPAGQDMQSLVDLVAQVCGVSTAAINILSSDKQHQIATAGFEPSVCSRDDSMCGAILEEGSPIVVSDASQDPRFRHNPFVTGELASVRFYASAPISTPEGLPIGRLCVFDDIPRDLDAAQVKALAVLAAQVTDMLELRFRSRALEDSLRELTQVRDELRRSNEHLTLFAGQISHDLRTPLTAILVNAELLATEPAVAGDTAVSEMVEAVDKAGRRMEGMIAEMLSFARQGGRLSVVEVDLRRVVDLVLTDVASLVRDDAEVQVGDLPRVMGDPDLLYSVLLNLVTNALKFARPGASPHVSITADPLAEHWRIRVDDDGIGVPQDRQESMFALFTRGDGDVAGHGIGLATAKRIVEAHGGTIGMESLTAGGTSVWFDLPL